MKERIVSNSQGVPFKTWSNTGYGPLTDDRDIWAPVSSRLLRPDIRTVTASLEAERTVIDEKPQVSIFHLGAWGIWRDQVSAGTAREAGHWLGWMICQVVVHTVSLLLALRLMFWSPPLLPPSSSCCARAYGRFELARTRCWPSFGHHHRHRRRAAVGSAVATALWLWVAKRLQRDAACEIAYRDCAISSAIESACMHGGAGGALSPCSCIVALSCATVLTQPSPAQLHSAQLFCYFKPRPVPSLCHSGHCILTTYRAVDVKTVLATLRLTLVHQVSLKSHENNMWARDRAFYCIGSIWADKQFAPKAGVPFFLLPHSP